MTIADLKNQNAKLVEEVAALERCIAESDGRDGRMVEEFYRGMIEDMREAQKKEIASQISALAASGKDNFDGSPGSDNGLSSGAGTRNDGDASSPATQQTL